MAFKKELKNTSNQPLDFAVEGETVRLNARKSIIIDAKAMTDQIENLKARGLLKVTNR